MEHDPRISQLLQSRRGCQPPPEYFETFLSEFQLRQRREVIHRSMWRILGDRIGAFLPVIPVPRLVLVGSCAVAAVSAVSILDWSGDVTDPTTGLVQAVQGSNVQYVLPERPVSYASARRF